MTFGKIMICVAALVPLMLRAATYDVPSGDLASPTVWGKGMPTGSDIIIFRSKASALNTFTLSANTNLSAYAITSSECKDDEKGVLFDFSDGNHTLTLPYGFGMRNSYDSLVTFRGGTWDASATNLNFNGDVTWTLTGQRTITDGATFLCNNLSMLQYVKNSAIAFSNKTSITVTGDAIFGKHNAESVNGTAEILDGSRVQIAGNTYIGRYNDTDTFLDHNLKVRVSGEKTEVKMSDSKESWIGYGSSGNELIVENGAHVSGYNLVIGQGGHACTNRLVIRSGGTVTNAASMEIGRWNAASRGQRIEILDGGELALGPSSANGVSLYLGMAGYDNSLLVSNGLLNCRAVLLGKATTSTGNGAEIRGASSRLTLRVPSEKLVFFGSGSGNRWTFSDHFSFSHPSTIVYSDPSTSTDVYGGTNTVIVEDGATVKTENEFHVGSTSYENSNNRLEVRNGGRVEADKGLYLRGQNSTIVVSNATLAVGNNPASSYFLRLGYDPSISTKPSTNEWLVLEGLSPVVTNASGRMMVQIVDGTHSGIRFVLPENGVYSAPPITCIQFQVGDDSMIAFENIEKLRKSLAHRVDIPLIYANDGGTTGHMWLIENDQKRLKKINETLPDGAYCWFDPVSSGSMSGTVYLRVKPQRGLSVMFK